VASLWQVLYDGSAGSFVVDQAGGPFSVGASNGLRWNQTSAGSSTYRVLEFHVEDASTFNNGDATFSFYATGAAATTIGAEIVQNFGTGGSPSAEVQAAYDEFSVTTTPQLFSLTAAMPSTASKTFGSNMNDFVKLRFYFPASSTFNVVLQQARFERGSAVTPFQQVPLSLKHAYIERYIQFTKLSLGAKADFAGEYLYVPVPFRTKMRAAPTISSVGSTRGNLGGTGAPAFVGSAPYGASAYIQSGSGGAYYAVDEIVMLDARL
jgi:hypothetical protein